MSDDGMKERIKARAQLQLLAERLYADPVAAVRSMRLDAHQEGAATVRARLESDFAYYGEVHPAVHGPSRVRAQAVFRDGGLGTEVERLLGLDHSPPDVAADKQIEQNMMIPTAEELGRQPADPPLDTPAETVGALAEAGAPGVELPGRHAGEAPPDAGWRAPEAPPAEVVERRSAYPGDAREGLSAEERLAYDQIEAFAEAKHAADRRERAEAELHAIYDHRAHLAAAEASLPVAKNALRAELEASCRDGGAALGRIEESMKMHGPAETAARIRAGELVAGNLKAGVPPKGLSKLFSRPDTSGQLDARERIAKRVETIGYYEGDLGSWSTFKPADGPPVQGVSNVRAVLDREEARVLLESGLTPDKASVERNRPQAIHPAREASMLGQAAQRHLDGLSSESRERVRSAAQRSGSDRMSAALGHLQTLQSAVRTFREGMEGPVH